VLCLVIVNVNVTKYMTQKCQKWQICGCRCAFSSSKCTKTL